MSMHAAIGILPLSTSVKFMLYNVHWYLSFRELCYQLVQCCSNSSCRGWETGDGRLDYPKRQYGLPNGWVEISPESVSIAEEAMNDFPLKQIRFKSPS